MGRAMRTLPIPVLCVAAALLCAAASAQRLLSPWDAVSIAPGNASYTCPTPPPFAITLSAEGYYTDKQYSVIDPKKLAAFNQATAGPTHLGQYATLAADAWLSHGSRAAATCVYSLLTAAAAANAWDEKMPDNNGSYLQNWVLSGAGVAYLKVRNSGAGAPVQDAAIQEWLRRLAAREREYFDAGRDHPGSDAWNNHMYWAGLALAVEGVACNDPDAFRWGLATYRIGIDAIQPDGSLNAEMARAERALHYQLYALGPLVMLAEFGEANGIPMYAEKDGALHRLVRFDIAAMQDPAIITKRAGIRQDIAQPYTYSGLEIGWAVPYVRRFPNSQLSAWITQAPWVNFWQWGGAPPGIPATGAGPSAADLAALAPVRNSIEQALNAQFATTGFLGAWCVEGDPDRHASIAEKNDALVLDNGLRSSSSGDLSGQGGIFAPEWQVLGTLTPDRTQLDWTNGTYWMRCVAHPLGRLPRLGGTWIAMGLRSKPCSIQQHGRDLSLDNGLGATGTGRVDRTGAIHSDWSGNPILGQLTPDGNHINWDNQTYWTRASVYQSPKQTTH
jgi:poly(beta-D-mannuronate) lyase